MKTETLVAALRAEAKLQATVFASKPEAPFNRMSIETCLTSIADSLERDVPNNAERQTTEPVCEACDGLGYNLFSNNDIPPEGFVIVVRCHTCGKYGSDLEAARAYGASAHWMWDEGITFAICIPPKTYRLAERKDGGWYIIRPDGYGAPFGRRENAEHAMEELTTGRRKETRLWWVAPKTVASHLKEEPAQGD